MHASAPVVNIFSARPEIKFRNEMEMYCLSPTFQGKSIFSDGEILKQSLKFARMA